MIIIILLHVTQLKKSQALQIILISPKILKDFGLTFIIVIAHLNKKL